jgi:sortase A
LRRSDLALLVAGLLLVGGCGTTGSTDAEPAPGTTPGTPETTTRVPAAPSSTSEPPRPEPRPPFVVSDGAARDATMSIPRLRIRDVPVRAYRGRTDDAPGHAIQNDGVLASPHGPRGGTGPGGVGNYQVTGHRTSATRVFEFLPDLRRGDRVRVTAGDVVYVYEIRFTRITSFRSAGSLREQRAPVPGRPGAVPTRAMITLSTCRTQEDHAEGNFWADRFDNPEHRIDKIGVLVRTRPARG